MQSLAAQLGNGEGVSAEYVARRKAIERQHGNSDGTLQHFARLGGERSEYADDLPDPISDASPIHVLAYYGLQTTELELLERNDCFTIEDVRTVIGNHDIPSWDGATRVTERIIRDAVDTIPEVIG